MGIRLEWEIQAEQLQVQNGGEDPAARRARRTARLRLLAVIAVVLALLAALAAAIVLRLREVDAQIEQLLRDTVDAEVTSLRLGDYTKFAELQQSASDDWAVAQKAVFDNYQALKLTNDVQYTGRILDVEIQKQRGRVRVEEIIDGAPYTRIWFYFRYPDGRWYHVPPDYTFWGELRTYVGEGVTVRYRDVDNAAALEVGLRFKDWLRLACVGLVCGDLPDVTVEIVPREGLEVGWSQVNPWVLEMPSPYLGVARSDMPFSFDMRFKTADLLAERLITVASNYLQPAYPADAYYLRDAVVNWLVGRFVGIETNSFLVESLAAHYGDPVVGVLLQTLQPDSSMSVLAQVTGVPTLEQAGLDWRDLLTWRLATETDLIARGDEAGYLSLYDTRDEIVRGLAYMRYDSQTSPQPMVVVDAPPVRDDDGSAMLRALVNVGPEESARQEEVLFRLVDDVWKRAS